MTAGLKFGFRGLNLPNLKPQCVGFDLQRKCKKKKKDTAVASIAHRKTMFVPTDIQTPQAHVALQATKNHEPTRSIVVERVRLKRQACVYTSVCVWKSSKH